MIYEPAQRLKDNFLLEAARQGNVKTIVATHAAGANLNALEERDLKTKKESRTPLILAVENGHLEACQKLLDLGAKVDGRGSHGTTPLMKAASENQGKICELLIKHNATIDIRNSFDSTPLLLAIRHKCSASALVLIEHKANVNVQDINGDTPLIHATVNGDADICLELLKHGADPELANHAGTTALMLAAKKDQSDTCQLLLDHGADTETKNSVGETALLIAADQGKTGTGYCLLHAGAEKKDHPKINAWLSSLRIILDAHIPPHTIPDREKCFDDGKISTEVLDACATGQFATRVAAPLIASTNPEDRKLFQEIWDKLPPYWQRTYAATHVAFVKAGGVNPTLGHHTGAHRGGSTPSSNVGVA